MGHHDRDPYRPFWWMILIGLAAVGMLAYALFFYQGGTLR